MMMKRFGAASALLSLSLSLLAGCDATAPDSGNLVQRRSRSSDALPSSCHTYAYDSGDDDLCVDMDTLHRAALKLCYYHSQPVGDAGPMWVDSVTPDVTCANGQYRSASIQCCDPPPIPEGCQTPEFFLSPGVGGACQSRDDFDAQVLTKCQSEGKRTAQVFYQDTCGNETYRIAYGYCCN